MPDFGSGIKRFAVALNIPPDTCAKVSLQVCNGPGQMCSLPFEVPFCPKHKHRVK